MADLLRCYNKGTWFADIQVIAEGNYKLIVATADIGLRPSSLFTTNLRTVPDSECIADWLQERVMPRERQGVAETLKQIGLDSYDVIDILSKTEGKCYRDKISIDVKSVEYFIRTEIK
jgi:hypothetical protein